MPGFYHLRIKIGSRSTGRSAVAAAAYRSGTKMEDLETGIVADYTKKGGVAYSEIVLPEGAPSEYADRSNLWNAVEKVEKQGNAQLFREFEIAFPKELTPDQWIGAAREFAKHRAAEGMIVDFSIHVPDKGAENPHCHMMCTTRPIKENGEWGEKEKKGYKLDKKGQKIPVIDPETGKQKIGARGRKMWQREKIDATGWDNKSKVLEWRAKWSEVVNKYLEPEQKIDHRSYKDQGLDRIPTIHEGFVARKIDKELQAENPMQHSELVQKNIQIREQNRLIQKMNEIRLRITEKARALYDRIRELTGNGKLDRSVGAELAIAGAGKQGIEGIKRDIERRERETPSILERARARITALKEKSISKDISNTDIGEETQEVRHNAGSEQLAGLIKRRTARSAGLSNGASGSDRSAAAEAGKSALDKLRARARAAESAREKREAEQLRSAVEESREIKPKRSRGQDLSL